MNPRCKIFGAIMVFFTLGLAAQVVAQPVFENNTPVGFSPSDSSTTALFVTDKDVTVLVDLNEAANATNPVIGNFHRIEKSVPFFTNASTAGYMDQAIEVDASGVIHRAWIQQRGFANTGVTTDPQGTPVYGVVYAKSLDGGKSFSDTISVSGTLRFDMLTPALDMSGAFSTVDIVVNSKGNPRVVYAFDRSADGRVGFAAAQTFGAQRQFNNIFFNYSNDGGSTWLPGNDAVVINDVATAGSVEGRKCAFPRMAIASTDDIFITYQRDFSAVTTAHDVMVAKVDEDSLKGGSAQAVRIGEDGNVGSFGGVRITPDGVISVSPDIAIGDDDVIHVVYYHPAGNAMRHKSMRGADWTDVSAFGWDNTAQGSSVGTITDDEATNQGLDASSTTTFVGDWTSQIIDSGAPFHFFPTVVVDKERTPDRVYVVWKHTDAASGATAIGNDENIAFNTFNYDGSVGGTATWGSTQFAFPQGTDGSLYQTNGGPLFQNSSRFQVESFWPYVDRVAVVVDDRIPDSRGDVHIVFSGGPSQIGGTTLAAALAAAGAPGLASSLYYSRFNGSEWELPTVLASVMHARTASATEVHDGGLQAQHRGLFAPDIAVRSGDDNVYLTFVGGSPRTTGTEIGNRAHRAPSVHTTTTPGRGFASVHQADVQPLPYFKVIGRVVSFDDVSTPVGAFQYQLTYNPINPQTALALKNLVAVTAADNADGSGIGGATPGASAAPGGFLTGQWRRLGSFSLALSSLNAGEAGAIFKGAISQSQATNDNGVWEGKVDDDGSSGFAEWGDDADKVGLLVKLNVLGSDSANNQFIISTSSSAKFGAIGTQATEATNADSSTQNITIDTSAVQSPASASFVVTTHTFPKTCQR